MSYLVLARKYRPQTFQDVVEQNQVTRTLMNAISSGRVAHAILFSGPRGTGKTTAARILAKAMNCEKGPAAVPCNQCRSCREITSGHAVDVFEIDGASNNSVDQVRELRENIKYMPAHSLYKIYIIDEVHMLSTPAFNALLKTLEEPPAHILFIFATTEPHKIPITILSRCQRHDFKRIPLDAITGHMGSLCSQEGIDITEESLGLIARQAGGSMRDALSLLDQVVASSEGAVAREAVVEALGIVDRESIFRISESVLNGSLTEMLDILDDIYSRGHDMRQLFSDLLEHFRNMLVVRVSKNFSRLVDLPVHEIERIQSQVTGVSAAALNRIFDSLFRTESVVRLSAQPKLAIELALIRLTQEKPTLPIDVLIETLDRLRQSSCEPGGEEARETAAVFGKAETPPSGASETGIETRQTGGTAEHDKPANSEMASESGELPERLLAFLSRKYPALAPHMKNCAVRRKDEHQVEIEVNGSEFNLNMIRREKNMAILKKTCSDLLKTDVRVIIKENVESKSEEDKKKSEINRLQHAILSHPLVADTMEIFDGRVVEVKILQGADARVYDEPDGPN